MYIYMHIHIYTKRFFDYFHEIHTQLTHCYDIYLGLASCHRQWSVERYTEDSSRNDT